VVGFLVDENGHFYLVDGENDLISITLNGCLNAEQLVTLRSSLTLKVQLEQEESERMEIKNTLEEICREILTPIEVNVYINNSINFTDISSM